MERSLDPATGPTMTKKVHIIGRNIAEKIDWFIAERMNQRDVRPQLFTDEEQHDTFHEVSTILWHPM